MGEDQDAVAQQLTAVGTAQVVETGHLLGSEASTGGEDQQDGMNAAFRHGHGSGELSAHFRLACCSVKQACRKQSQAGLDQHQQNEAANHKSRCARFVTPSNIATMSMPNLVT